MTDRLHSPRVPISRGYPLVGNLFKYQKNRLGLLSSLHQQHGDRFKVKIGPKILTVLTSPEDVEAVMVTGVNQYIKKTNFDKIFRQGLFTANKEAWREQRQTLQALFSPKYLSDSMEVIDRVALKHINALKSEIKEGESVDFNKFLAKLTFDLILQTIIGHDFYEQFDKLHDSLSYCANYLTYESYNPLPFAGVFSPYKEEEFLEHLSFIDRTVFDVVRAQKDPSLRKDHSIISAMLNAVDKGKLKQLSPDILRDNIVGLIFAGYETTALTMGWWCSLMADHGDVQKRLREEIQSEAHFEQVPLLENSFKEVMRLYPAGWAFTRVAEEAGEVNGVSVGKGEILLLSPYLTHRDPKLWDNPNQFDIGRWDKEPVHKFAYFPFGSGPRMCIGKNLAYKEMKIIGRRLLEHFDFIECSERPIPFPLATLSSKNGFRLKVRSRI